jgi:peptidoglycan/LPS O-acetylase OafA/YrhL
MGMRESFGAAWLIPTWSLAVEEQFYLVVPALALLAPRRFARVALAAILAAPLLRFLFPGFHTYLLSPFRADSLAAGVLLAIVLENQAARAWVMRRRQSFGHGLVGMVGLTVFFTFFRWLGPLEFTWLAGLYAVLLLLALTAPQSGVAGVMRWAPLRWIGVRSYGLYLFHLPVLGLIQGFRGHDVPQVTGIGDIGATLVALAVSLLVAAMSFRYIERPFIELGQRSRYRIDAPDGAARSAPVV